MLDHSRERVKIRVSRREQVVPLRQLDDSNLPVLPPLFAVQLSLMDHERREGVHLL